MLATDVEGGRDTESPAEGDRLTVEGALEAVAELLAKLPEEIAAAAVDIKLHVAERPTMYDRLRGIPPGVAGAYIETDPRVLAPTDDDEPPPPAGTIKLYLDNIDPCDAEGVSAIFLHELLHVLGVDEDGCEGVGF